jgi:hypothetical protein
MWELAHGRNIHHDGKLPHCHHIRRSPLGLLVVQTGWKCDKDSRWRQSPNDAVFGRAYGPQCRGNGKSWRSRTMLILFTFESFRADGRQSPSTHPHRHSVQGFDTHRPHPLNEAERKRIHEINWLSRRPGLSRKGGGRNLVVTFPWRHRVSEGRDH